MSLLVQAADYLGNYALSSIVYFKFSVTDATGVLTTLGGTPAVKVYKDNGTTESTAGITLTVDFDSRTGLCQVAIDTSSDGTFYAGGHDFEAVITAGTVGLVSVAGTPVGHFSLLNRVDTLADGVSHGGTLGSSTATLALKQIKVFTTVGNATHFETTSVTGSGLACYGATGLDCEGLVGYGTGIYVNSSAGAGNAILCESYTIGSVLKLNAWGSGGNSGSAVELLGQGTAFADTPTVYISAVKGSGIQIEASGSGNHDIKLVGSGDILGNLAGTIDGVTATGLDNILIDGKTLRAALKIIAAVVAGKVSGAGTAIETFIGLDGSTTRAVATVDASGNRSAWSYP